MAAWAIPKPHVHRHDRHLLFRIPLAALSAYVFHAPLVFIWIVIAVDQVARF